MSTSNTLLSADEATISRLNDRIQILEGANDYKTQELEYMHNTIMDKLKYIEVLEKKLEEIHNVRGENANLRYNHERLERELADKNDLLLRKVDELLESNKRVAKLEIELEYKK